MKGKKIERKGLILKDGRITLRPYCKDDAGQLYESIRASLTEMGRWLPFAHMDYSLDESKDWIKKQPAEWKKGKAFNFAICDANTGEQIGGCGINEVSLVDMRANLGYWVRSDRTGRGIAPAAARLLAKWGFEVLGLQRIEITVALENTRSLRAAEKAGAKREGVLRNRINIGGKMHDAVMHSLLPGEV